MNKMNCSTNQHELRSYADEEIDLRILFRQLWEGKKTVFVSGFVAALCALGLTYSTTEYVSTGFLQANSIDDKQEMETIGIKEGEAIGITAYNYGKYAEILANNHNFRNYLDRRADVSGEVMASLRRYVVTPSLLQKLFSPVFAGTEKEQKTWGVKLDPKQAGQFLGLTLSIAAKEPNNGEAISVLEDYFRDTISRVAFGEYFPEVCGRHQRKILALKANIGSTNFDIQQEENRITLLKPLVSSTIQNGIESARQVVSVDGESKNFLSPRVHVSASEVKVAGLRLKNDRNEMLVKESEVMAHIYCAAEVARGKWSGLDKFFVQLDLISSQAFDERNLDFDLVLRLRSEFQLDSARLKDVFQKRMRLIQPAAQLESKVKKAGYAISGIFGIVVGLVLGCGVVLIRNWWFIKGSTDAK